MGQQTARGIAPSSPLGALMAEAVRQRRERNALVARLMTVPGGVVLATHRMTDGSPMGVAITVSMEEPGKWRVSYFDADGFSGHSVEPTRLRALQRAVDEGYRDIDRDLLRRLSRTDRFRSTIWRV